MAIAWISARILFSREDTEILNIVLDLFESAVIPRERSVKFFYQGKFLDYPLTAYSVLFQMGLWSGLHAGLSFIKSKLTPRKIIPEEEETVEDWAVQSFGNHLYQTFFKPYTEQFWKISCSELSSRSIPTHTRMSFFNTLRLLFRRRFSKTDWSLIEREMLPTYYPETGFQEIAEHIAEQAKRNGATICLGCRAIGLENTQNNRVRVRYESDQLEKQIEGSHVISTIPLNQLVKMIKPLPPPDVLAAAGRLDYRSLIALGMVTEKQNILNCSYIYVLNRPYNRISEMNEFSPYTSPSGENILVVEIPCLYGSAAWNASREELFDICIGSLAEDGFIMPGDVKRLLLYKMPFAYPHLSQRLYLTTPLSSELY